MVEAIGMTVVNLHRTSFAGISLKGVKEGDWMELTEKEMALVTQAIGISEKNGSGSSNQGTKYFEELSE